MEDPRHPPNGAARPAFFKRAVLTGALALGTIYVATQTWQVCETYGRALKGPVHIVNTWPVERALRTWLGFLPAIGIYAVLNRKGRLWILMAAVLSVALPFTGMINSCFYFLPAYSLAHLAILAALFALSLRRPCP